MADYLAEVTMPPKPKQPTPPPSPEPVITPEETTEEPVLVEKEETGEENPNLVYDIVEEPVKKEKLKKEDIFKKRKPPEIPEDIPPPVIKEVKPKKKRVLSEKQLETLARGRATAKANREAKKKPKPSEVVAKPPPEADPPPKLARTHSVSYTLEDLENATEKAIEKYETKRKARKAVKKKEEADKKHEEKVFKDIHSAISKGPPNGWDICFN